MSDYPAYNQLIDGSQLSFDLPTQHLSSVNGTPLGVVRGSARRRRFPIKHVITDSEFQTIMTLFRAVQRAGQQSPSFTFTSDFDATEYNVYFGAQPERVKVGPDLYEVNVLLVEAP